MTATVPPGWWLRTTGEAVSGPHQGRRLAQANDLSPLFWFAWLNAHPETEVYADGRA